MEGIKIAGAGMILLSATWTGIHAALRLRRTQRELMELSAALDTVSAEIRFTAAPFAPLCKRAGEGRCETVRRFFERLAEAGNASEPAAGSLTAQASREAGLVLPQAAIAALSRVFDDFGRCDREGQLRQLALAAGELERLREELNEQMEGRCRSYRILGFSAGAAVLVLVL